MKTKNSGSSDFKHNIWLVKQTPQSRSQQNEFSVKDLFVKLEKTRYYP